MTELGKQELTLTATCPGATGIVAAVSGFLADQGCYIVEMSEFDDVRAGRFFVRAVFRERPDDPAGLDTLRDGFTPIAERFDMQWKIHDNAVLPKVMVLVSRHEHCLNDLLYRYRTGALKVELVGVASNHPDLRGLTEWHGVPYEELPHGRSKLATKAAQEERIRQLVSERGVELLVLARYMQVLSDELCAELPGRIINIHHSFLPGFKGARPYHQAYDRGVKLIGATAHYVTPELDEGPIIEQAVERVDHTYRPAELVAAGRDIESMTLARAVRFHIERRVFVNGCKTVVFRR
jgi:formyltetrahydrofolate deformylase